MLLALLSIAAGLVLLYGGAEGLVRGASALALRMGLTPLVVGLTVVAFGTSAPELVVSLQAALAGRDAIALGNVVGSNVANIAFILGLAAILQPMRVHGQLLKLDVPMMLGSASLLVVMLLDGHLGRFEGGSLFAMLVLYLGYNVWKARTERQGLPPALAAPDVPASLPAGRALFFAGAGLALLALGADLLVDGAVVMARAAGLSEAVVGLTVVAIGTSLPELATSLVATLRGEGDIALGNVVGSNIFNVLGILGISALVHPLERSGVAPVDLLVMLAASMLLLPLLRSGLLLARWEGALLLSVYTVYMLYLL